MGKGKGTLLRWSARIPRFFFFLEFANLDFIKLNKFSKKLNYKFYNTLRMHIDDIKIYPF
jgi:hypothetical protein